MCQMRTRGAIPDGLETWKLVQSLSSRGATIPPESGWALVLHMSRTIAIERNVADRLNVTVGGDKECMGWLVRR